MKELFERCIATEGWTLSGDDVHYKLEREADRLMLIFSATWDQHGWAHNFDIAVQAYKDSSVQMLVHKGFKEMYHSVRDEIMLKIGNEVALGAKYLTIAGFSQGGALAVLAHEDAGFQHRGLDTGTVTFGAPKVLYDPSLDIRARFNSLMRYAVRGDIVTMLAPWYTHVGQRKLIGPLSLPWPWNHQPDAYLRSLS